VGATTLYYIDPKQNYAPVLLSGTLQSHILTVWRTLRVELDQLQKGTSGDTAGFPLINFAITEFAKACIDVKPYAENSRPTMSGASGMLNVDWATFFGQYDDPCDAAGYRDSPKATNTFWTTLLIGAFQNANYEAGRYYSHNTGFVFHGEIDIEFPINPPNPNPDNTAARSQVALHELGHAFLGKQHTPGTVMHKDLILGNQTFSTSQLQAIQAKPKPD